jgi:hypothetical protein
LSAGAVPLVVVGASLVAACAAPVPKRVDFSETRRNYRAQDYAQVLRTWTRHDKVVRDVGTVIEAWATFKSWDFRQAYVESYASAYAIPEADREALYNAQLVAARKSYEFHVVVQTTKYQWNDLEKERTAWRVALVDGAGAVVEPSAVEPHKLPEPYETQFFPYRTEFSRTYVIRFNKEDADAAGFSGPKSGRIVLRIASPMGRAELVWESL